MSNRFRGRIVDNPGGTFYIDEDVEVVVITTSDSDPIELPSVTAAGSNVGVGWRVEIQDPNALMATGLAIYPNPADTGFLINGNPFFTIPGPAHSLTVTYQGDGLWQVIGYTPAGSGHIYKNIAYVHPNGDNATGVVGDLGKPFATMLGAYYGAYPNGLQIGSGNIAKNAVIHVMSGVTGSIDNRNPFPSITPDYEEAGYIFILSNNQLHVHLETNVRMRLYQPLISSETSFFELDNGGRLWLTSEDRNSGFEVQGGGAEGDNLTKYFSFLRMKANCEVRIENLSIYTNSAESWLGVNAMIKADSVYSAIYMKNVTMIQDESFLLSVPSLIPQVTCFINSRANVLELIDCHYYRRTLLYQETSTSRVAFAYLRGGNGNPADDNYGRSVVTLKNFLMEMRGFSNDEPSYPQVIHAFVIDPDEPINQTGGIWLTFSNCHFRWTDNTPSRGWEALPFFLIQLSGTPLANINVGGLSQSRANWGSITSNLSFTKCNTADNLTDVIAAIGTSLENKKWRNTMYIW